MSRSPETVTTVESISYGTRMKIENHEGQGVIFAAEFDSRDYQALNLYWPTKTDLDAIKKAVNEANEGEVQWTEDVHGNTDGELKNGRFWYSPYGGYYAARAGMQLEITDPTKLDSFLETVAQLAPKTCSDSVTMPSDLRDKLTEFALSIQPKINKMLDANDEGLYRHPAT